MTISPHLDREKGLVELSLGQGTSEEGDKVTDQKVTSLKQCAHANTSG